MKIKFAAVLLIIIMLFSGFGIFASPKVSPAEKLEINISSGSDKLFDGNNMTFETLAGKIHLNFNKNARYIYLVFLKDAVSFSVGNEKVENNFLHCLVDLKSLKTGITNSVDLEFENAKVSEISAYSDGELPAEAEDWKAPCEKADLLLVSTHADDEQLFFAGILPLYAGQKKLRVQVAYFTNHNADFRRNHELLSGLWTAGVRNYPEIGEFPDAWAENKEQALINLSKAGFSYSDTVGFQTYLLRRYKPLVAVGHDFSGEYGHGQHILNAASLSEAVKNSGDENFYPESAQKFGIHTVKKFYVHLYAQNEITLDIDAPLENFGGKTAFEITKDGFKKHISQQNTWFREWLCGTDGNRAEASSIKKYSPCKYGLYFSSAEKEDVLKNDFFENIVTYDEQEKAEIKEEKIKEKPAKEKSEVKAEKKNQGGKIFYILIPVLLLAATVTAFFFIKKSNKN